MPAFAQSGSEARMYGPQGNFNENAVKGFESTVEGDIVARHVPGHLDGSVERIPRSARKVRSRFSQDYNSLGGMGTWAAYEGFKQVVESMKGEVNNETFLKAAETAKINLPGMVPPVNFAENWGKTGGPKGFERINNRCVVFSEFKEGKLQPASHRIRRRLRNRRRHQTDGLRSSLRMIRTRSTAPGTTPGAAGAL